MKELTVIRNGLLVLDGRAFKGDVVVEGGIITAIAEGGAGAAASADCTVREIDADGCIVCGALADVHVHFRVPGNPEKETVETGSAAAAFGGYTAVCTMPNLTPAPDSMANLQIEQDIIDREAVVAVHPFASITVGRKGEEIVDFAALLPHCVGFSDDGSGVQSEAVMRAAMEGVAAVGGIISAHCEDTSFASARESEWREVERDLRLAEETGCRFHVCHISTKESVNLIRGAKKRGVKVSCETAPHYLTLCTDDILDDGRYKMNPPLADADDREALIAGLLDGTIDVIATDHAPHTLEEKSRGFAGSLNGIVGLETAFPVMYTKLVKGGVISVEKLVSLMSEKPREIFSLGGGLAVGARAELAVFDVSHPFTLDSSSFASKGRSTPFDGWEVYGRCILTMHDGRTIYEYI